MTFGNVIGGDFADFSQVDTFMGYRKVPAVALRGPKQTQMEYIAQRAINLYSHMKYSILLLLFVFSMNENLLDRNFRKFYVHNELFFL